MLALLLGSLGSRQAEHLLAVQADGKPIPQASCSFAQARPSYTHMALKRLVDAGKVHYVVSQVKKPAPLRLRMLCISGMSSCRDLTQLLFCLGHLLV